MLDLIQKHNNSVNHINKNGRAVMHYAACNPSHTLEVIKILVESGGNLSVKDRSGKNVLEIYKSVSFQD